jgi:threonine dehydrogenase-like Zn-dependent dehydrogenase
MEDYPMAVVTAPGKVEFVKRTLPPVGDHDVLLRVKACAICGGDLHIYKGKHPLASLPMAIGHELSGEVIQTGNSVTRTSPGDRIAVEPVIPCGKCYFCLRGEYHLCQDIRYQYAAGQGGFTPFFAVSENWVHRLPDFLSFEEGALGAGGIGLFLVQVARAAGCGSVFVADLLDHRLKTALTLGATAAMNAAREDPVERILKETDSLGVDRSFEAVGAEKTLHQCAQSLKKGGICALIGLFEEAHHIHFPINLFVQKEIQIRGCRGYCWDFQVALDLVKAGGVKLKPLISHQLPLTDLPMAFEILSDPKAKAGKVVIHP